MNRLDIEVGQTLGYYVGGRTRIITVLSTKGAIGLTVQVEPDKYDAEGVAKVSLSSARNLIPLDQAYARIDRERKEVEFNHAQELKIKGYLEQFDAKFGFTPMPMRYRQFSNGVILYIVTLSGDELERVLQPPLVIGDPDAAS